MISQNTPSDEATGTVVAAFEVIGSPESIRSGDRLRLKMTFRNLALEELAVPHVPRDLIGRIDARREDGSEVTLIERPLELLISLGDQIEFDLVFDVECTPGAVELVPRVFRSSGEGEELFVDRGTGATLRVDPAITLAAQVEWTSAPERVWGFEPNRFGLRVTDLGTGAVADDERLVISLDLVRPDGSRVTTLAQDAVEIASGEAVSREFDLYIRAFEGPFELRAELFAKRGDASRRLPIKTRPLDVEVESTIQEMFIELTNICNFRCNFCPQGDLIRPSAMMDLDLAKKILRDLADMGHHHPLRLHLLGETLLYPQMREFVEAAHELGLELRIATNGSRFQPERIDMLFETRLDEVVVSLNTPEKHLYEEQRGTDVSFEKYMEGIRAYIAEVVRRGAPPATTINILFDGSRIREPEELERVERITNEWIDFVSEVGGKKIPYMANLELNLQGETKTPIMDGLELQWTSYHNWGEAGPPKDHFCQFPWTQLAVLVDGKVTACCVDAQGEIVLGDVNEQTVAEVWRGEPLQKMRAGFLTGCAVEDRCARCDVHSKYKWAFFPDGQA